MEFVDWDYGIRIISDTFKYSISIIYFMRIEINKYIVSDSEICGGTPTFKGTRIMVWQILEMLEAGMPAEEIMTSFITPLTREHIKAALHYAGIIAKGEGNIVIGYERY